MRPVGSASASVAPVGAGGLYSHCSGNAYFTGKLAYGVAYSFFYLTELRTLLQINWLTLSMKLRTYLLCIPN